MEMQEIESTTPPEEEQEKAEPAPESPSSAEMQSPDVELPIETLPAISTEELLPETELQPEQASADEAQIKAILEAIIYITEEPLTKPQIVAALNQPLELIEKLLSELTAEYEKPEHGLTVREVAGGYKITTKPEHHEAVRAFVKSLKPPLKLSLAALETLAVIAYKQPITSPEVMEVRGVQGAGVLKTLLERKLIASAGRKAVIGKPVLYKTTKEFLIQFGLKDLSELPSLKEFEEIRRMSIPDAESEPAEAAPAAVAEQPTPQDPGSQNDGGA